MKKSRHVAETRVLCVSALTVTRPWLVHTVYKTPALVHPVWENIIICAKLAEYQNKDTQYI